MTEADRTALKRLVGGEASSRASTDDLQGLLLQVVFALLMIFMIAYFIFVAEAKKEHQEEVLALNRQKLVLALEKTAEDYRVKYGLNALMTQGVDGRRTFDADAFVRGGRLEFAPAAKSAFSQGSAAVRADYAARGRTAAEWKARVLESAGLSEESLDGSEREWLDRMIGENVEAVRLDARGVQRALAARLQRQWIERPESLTDGLDAADDVGYARGVKDKLECESLRLVSEEIGSEVLP